jgi:hypothetical protein
MCCKFLYCFVRRKNLQLFCCASAFALLLTIGDKFRCGSLAFGVGHRNGIYHPVSNWAFFSVCGGAGKLFDRFWLVRGLFERPGNVLACEGLDFIPVC